MSDTTVIQPEVAANTTQPVAGPSGMPPPKPRVRMVANDGTNLNCSADAAERMPVLRECLESSVSSGEAIRVDVQSEPLLLVVAWCEKHARGYFDRFRTAAEREEAAFAEFVEPLTDVQLFNGLMAANFLGVTDLLDALTKKTASFIRGKTAEEIRKRFNIKNDFEPEELEEIQRENMSIEQAFR